MKATQKLHQIGQSVWLDNITRELLDSGTLEYYISELSVTGLTSNPTIFHRAISESKAYESDMAHLAQMGKSGEELFFDLAISDLRRAAKLFEPIYAKTCGVDGFVSLEVSPLFAYDAKATCKVAGILHKQADIPNLFIKIPGTPEGLQAIEDSIFAGIPINVTLLFSREQYVAAADAYLRGVERRIEAGLKPDVPSVASVFVSRWDAAVAGKVSDGLANRLGIAMGWRIYKAYRDILASSRAQRTQNVGARPQRLLLASTGTKDPNVSDVLYVNALAAPLTVNTMPEATLNAFADHGELHAIMREDGGDCEPTLARFASEGIDIDVLAAKLQSDGAASFSKSWTELMSLIESKSLPLHAAHL